MTSDAAAIPRDDRRLTPAEAETLLGGYRGSLYGYIRRKGFSPEEADDLTQETLVRAFLHLHRFHGSALDGWLFRIAANLAVDRYRRRRVVTVPLDSVHPVESGEEGPAERLLRGERDRRILSLVEDLPACHRRILRMRYLEDRSLAEIAQAVNCSPLAAKLRVFRAVCALRRRWHAAEAAAQE